MFVWMLGKIKLIFSCCGEKEYCKGLGLKKELPNRRCKWLTIRYTEKFNTNF